MLEPDNLLHLRKLAPDGCQPNEHMQLCRLPGKWWGLMHLFGAKQYGIVYHSSDVIASILKVLCILVIPKKEHFASLLHRRGSGKKSMHCINLRHKLLPV